MSYFFYKLWSEQILHKVMLAIYFQIYLSTKLFCFMKIYPLLQLFEDYFRDIFFLYNMAAGHATANILV